MNLNFFQHVVARSCAEKAEILPFDSSFFKKTPKYFKVKEIDCIFVTSSRRSNLRDVGGWLCCGKAMRWGYHI